MNDPRLHDREILIAAMKELLALAEENKNDLDVRRSFVLEATRLGMRLLTLQKELGFDDD